MKTYIQNLGKNLRGVASKHVHPTKQFNQYLMSYGKAQIKYLPRGRAYHKLLKVEISNFPK